MEDALKDIFFDNQLDTVFPDIRTFINVFVKYNDHLWEKYRKGEIKKEILRFKRFDLTLQDYGVKDVILAKKLGEDYIQITPTKTALVPHSREILEYLKAKYHLHIITNGFTEVQLPKLQRCHIDHFFEWVVTSETSGFHKPSPEAFGYSLSKANARKEESLMVGDDLDIDILGAKKFGLDQIYFNPRKIPHKCKVTHEVSSLLDIKKIL